MASSRSYWRERSAARLLSSERKGVSTLGTVLDIYTQAQRNIDADIQRLYANYAKKGVLDKSELEKALDPGERKAFLRKVSSKVKALGLNPDDVFDDRYLDRLTRLQALKDQVLIEVMNIAPQEAKVSEIGYSEITASTYKQTQSDLETVGITPSFATIDRDTVASVLRSQWYGGNYSSRVWGNTEVLAKRLPIVLGAAFASGQSYQRTARVLQDEFDVSRYNATRLVRTETNYFHNQSELQSYIDDGFTEYEYDAVMDGRTSKICRGLNKKKFKISEAEVGVNYPPMHVHCRSTTVPVLSSVQEPTETPAERAARYNPGATNVALRKKFSKNIAQELQNPTPSEIDNLASKFSGQDLFGELDKYIRSVPKDDPTRPAKVKAAELHGWRY